MYFPPELLAHFASSHGVATIREMQDRGLTARQIKSLQAAKSLVPVLRGVYRIAAVPESELVRCLAVCRRHPTAVICGPTAGRLWSFRRLPKDLRVHATFAPAAQPSVESWLVPYRTAAIGDDDIVERDDGIRVTSRIRTAADLGRLTLPDSDLLSIVEQAMSDGRHSPDDVRRAIFPRRHRGRPWAQRTLDLLGDRVPGGAAESHAEFVVGEALWDTGMHELRRQYATTLRSWGRVRFDLAVPRLRWAIEVDVFPTHHETVGRDRDRGRDEAAAADGWDTTRLRPEHLGRSLPATVERLRLDYDARRSATAPLDR